MPHTPSRMLLPPSPSLPRPPAAKHPLHPLGLLGLWGLSLLASGPVHATGERINHEGRILGPAPTVATSILFNTPQADAVVSAMQIMPVDSPWNEDVSRRPLLANSSAMIAQIMADLASSRQTLRPFYEMNFALVPDTQPDVAISFFNYPDESDPSPYPIPGNLPVEGWPRDHRQPVPRSSGSRTSTTTAATATPSWSSRARARSGKPGSRS